MGGVGSVLVWVVQMMKATACLSGSFLNAPNYEGHVPVDMTPGPVPVHRAPKSLHHIPAGKASSWNCRSDCTITWKICELLQKAP